MYTTSSSKASLTTQAEIHESVEQSEKHKQSKTHEQREAHELQTKWQQSSNNAGGASNLKSKTSPTRTPNKQVTDLSLEKVTHHTLRRE